MNPAPRPIILFTVCFNAEKTLRRTIESVLANLQDDPHTTYIIQDGASTDGTLAIAREYEKHGVVIRSEKDRGAYDAIDKAILSVTDENALIGFIHGDDLLTPGSLARIRNLLQTSPQADLISMGCALQNESGHILRRYTGTRLTPTIANVFDVSALPNARLISKKLYNRVGLNQWQRPGFDYFMGADVDHMVRCILTRPLMVQDDTVDYVYLTHPGSTTLNLRPETTHKAHIEHLTLLAGYLSSSNTLPFTFAEELTLRRTALRIALQQAVMQRNPRPFWSGIRLSGWAYLPLTLPLLGLFAFRKILAKF